MAANRRRTALEADNGAGRAVAEGFLCPICKVDLGGPDELLEHNQIAHAQGEDEPFAWPPQQLGVERDRLEAFRKRRKARLDRMTLQSSQLVSRLDKLLYSGPDASQSLGKALQQTRKDFEQKIVPWMDDKLVPLCPFCAVSFGWLRRKHHCRLCGSVLCESCSLALPLETAVDMARMPSLSGSFPTHVAHDRPLMIAAEPLRICEHCDANVVRIQARQMHTEAKPSPFDKLYEKFKNLKRFVVESLDAFLELLEPLSQFQELSKYEDAVRCQVEIGQMLDALVGLGGMLAKMATDEGDSSYARIARQFSKYILSYVEEVKGTLKKLPSKDMIVIAREYEAQRAAELKARAEEKRRALELEHTRKITHDYDEISHSDLSSGHSRTSSNASSLAREHDAKAADVPKVLSISKVMSMQKKQIKEQIRQKKKEGKMDEVAMLMQQLMIMDDFKKSQKK